MVIQKYGLTQIHENSFPCPYPTTLSLKFSPQLSLSPILSRFDFVIRFSDEQLCTSKCKQKASTKQAARIFHWTKRKYREIKPTLWIPFRFIMKNFGAWCVCVKWDGRCTWAFHCFNCENEFPSNRIVSYSTHLLTIHNSLNGDSQIVFNYWRSNGHATDNKNQLEEMPSE